MRNYRLYLKDIFEAMDFDAFVDYLEKTKRFMLPF